MLYPERVQNAAKALPEGCFEPAYCQLANANRIAALIPPITFKRNISFIKRSTYQLYPICTQSDNLSTLSLVPQGIQVRKCFSKVSHLQNQKDCSLSGLHIHLLTNLK